MRLGLYVLKHIYIVQARGKLVPQEGTLEYIDLYICILDLEAHAYLQWKMCQGSLALTLDGANLIPSIPMGPQLSPHLGEAISNIYAPQQLGKMEEQFVARFHVAHWQEAF